MTNNKSDVDMMNKRLNDQINDIQQASERRQAELISQARAQHASLINKKASQVADDLSMRKKQLSERRSMLAKEKATANAKLKALNGQDKMVSEQLNDLKSRIDEISKNQERIRTEYREKYRELSKSNDNAVKYSDMYDESTINAAKSKDLMNRAIVRKQEATKVISSLKSDYAQYAAQLSKLNDEKASLETQKHITDEKVESGRSRLNDLHGESEDVKRQMREINDEIVKYRRENDEHSRRKMEAEKNEKIAQSKLKSLDSSYGTSADERIQQMSDLNATVMNERANAKAAVNGLAATTSMISSLVGTQSDMGKRLALVNSSINDVNKSVNMASAKSDNIQRSIDDAINASKSIADVMSTTKSKIDKYNSDKDLYARDVDKHNEDVHRHGNEAKDNLYHQQTHVNDINMGVKKLGDIDNKHSRGMRQMNNMMVESNNLEQQKATIQMNKDNVNEKLMMLEEKMRVLQRDLDDHERMENEYKNTYSK